MPRVKKTYPEPTRQKGQRSVDPLFLNRIFPQWGKPNWLEGEQWRRLVEIQPTALVCRDTLIDNITNLDWAIEPRDSDQRDELKSEIDYYTKLLENSGELDYTGLIEWILKDALDLPFGGAVEIIREYDEPEGKTLWLVPLDGATCFPTENFNYPVGQTNGTDYVYFPDYAVGRLYYSPRTDMRRYGWGVAPPEKIYMAMQMLNRGDVYYANLLLDTPQVGILDLMDMSEDSASQWIDAWRTLLGGIDPFKIPVLYEHTKEAKFISFTKSPTELMFDKALTKYVILVCAGYGMSTSDIGLPSSASGGETLSGSIRQERRTRRTGYAITKKKITALFDRILPKTLKFKFIDMDDELNVAVGRARLASATSFQQLLQMKVITPNEARQQLIADGLMTISMKETIEGGDKPIEQPKPFSNTTGSNQLGRPIAPSQGGFGEQKSLIQDEGLAIEIENDEEDTDFRGKILEDFNNTEEE